MIRNKIYLKHDSITICDVTDHDLKTIESAAAAVGCMTQVIEDDGTYYVAVVIGTEQELYDFMSLVFYGFSGIVF